MTLVSSHHRYPSHRIAYIVLESQDLVRIVICAIERHVLHVVHNTFDSHNTFCPLIHPAAIPPQETPVAERTLGVASAAISKPPLLLGPHYH